MPSVMAAGSIERRAGRGGEYEYEDEDEDENGNENDGRSSTSAAPAAIVAADRSRVLGTRASRPPHLGWKGCAGTSAHAGEYEYEYEYENGNKNEPDARGLIRALTPPPRPPLRRPPRQATSSRC